MDYKKMLKKQPLDKVALIEDGKVFTYRQLMDMAEEMRVKIQSDMGGMEPDEESIAKQLFFVEEDTVAGELAAFIACQGSHLVPVICTGELAAQQRGRFRDIVIPEEAVMGAATSGTTGEPKLLLRTYESWADFFPCQNRIFSMDCNTVMFAQGSLAFTGNLNLYLALFSIGGTVVATKRFEPRYWFSVIKQYGVDCIYLIPTKILALCRAVQKPYVGVKHLVTGSQSFGRIELEKVRCSFPEISAVSYYGSSEASYIAYLTDREMTGDSSLVGKAFPQVKVSIQNGLFYVQSACGIIGMEHLYCTGDMGRRDRHGNFYFEGRQDDLLNVNGRKCSAYRIEQAMREKLGVISVAVVRRERGRDILTVYYKRDTEFPSVVQVRRILKESLAGHEMPKDFIRVDRIPETDSGKVSKRGIV